MKHVSHHIFNAEWCFPDFLLIFNELWIDSITNQSKSLDFKYMHWTNVIIKCWWISTTSPFHWFWHNWMYKTNKYIVFLTSTFDPCQHCHLRLWGAGDNNRLFAELPGLNVPSDPGSCCPSLQCAGWGLVKAICFSLSDVQRTHRHTRTHTRTHTHTHTRTRTRTRTHTHTHTHMHASHVLWFTHWATLDWHKVLNSLFTIHLLLYSYSLVTDECHTLHYGNIMQSCQSTMGMVLWPWPGMCREGDGWLNVGRCGHTGMTGFTYWMKGLLLYQQLLAWLAIPSGCKNWFVWPHLTSQVGVIDQPTSCYSPLGRLVGWSIQHTSRWTLPLAMPSWAIPTGFWNRLEWLITLTPGGIIGVL